MFREAEALDAVLVFDEAEGLFGARNTDAADGASRHDTLNVGILLHHLETFTGICVVITNIRAAIDAAFFRRFSHVVEFPAPDAAMREKLWRAMIPKECPVADDVDLPALARNYALTGGCIKQALLRAARHAALRPEGQRRLTQEALRSSCDEERKKDSSSMTPEGIYA